MALSVLIIDDQPDIGWSFKRSLNKYGIDVRFTTQPEEGLMMMRYSPDVVLLDMKMPGMDGIEVLKRIKAEFSDQIVIMMTAFGSIDNAVDAMKLGAYHYIQKPFPTEDLMPILDRAKEVIDMRMMLSISGRTEDKGDFGHLDGHSPVMKKIFKRAQKVAEKPNTTVLILGQNGTGKEMLAKTIHELSDRRNQIFIPLNCSAIPDALLESELFGYEPGAFTGATRLKKGLFESADNGTLFLDEIGDMPFNLQSKILRVLEDGTFTRLGTEKEIIKVDVRVVAASNKDLEGMIKINTFREDLFYRLNTYTIVMPRLAERGDDIIVLALKFIDRYNQEMKLNIQGLSTGAARALKGFSWPGNVRQLRNSIENAMIECESDYIQLEDLPVAIRSGKEQQADLIAEDLLSSGTPTLEEMKNSYMLKILSRCKTDQEAASILDISRRTITRFKKDFMSQ